LDAVLHLKAEFPAFLRTYRHSSTPEETVELEFFQEEVAMDCAEKLSGTGIMCIYTLDRAKILSFPLIMGEEAESLSRVVLALENYFQALNFRWHAAHKNNETL
jgi:hypothetical protein